MSVLTVTRRARSRHGAFDTVTALTVFIFFLVAIPSRLIVGPLGSAGTPAEIIGMGMLAAWFVNAAGSFGRTRGVRQPLRIAVWIFFTAVVFSYIAANLRSMLSDEQRAVDAGMLLVLSWLGVLFAAMDGISTRERLDTVLRRLVLAAGALASLGVLQFITKQPFTNYIQIPGLSTNNALVSVIDRDGLTRPSGTALHPIEFGAVLTMCLPFALHYAIQDTHRTSLRRWYPVGVIAAAVLISISRSAILSAVVVMCFLIPTWSPAGRRRAYGGIVAVLVGAYLAVPGLLGTITSLFTGISGDSSAQSRTGSFSLAFTFFERTPIFGRGFLSWLPAYRIFDDQYLGLLVETGIVGLAAFLGLLVTGVLDGVRMHRYCLLAEDAGLGIAFAASIASALASFALFDAFSFPMASSLLYLLLGCLGALRRISATSQWRR